MPAIARFRCTDIWCCTGAARDRRSSGSRRRRQGAAEDGLRRGTGDLGAGRCSAAGSGTDDRHGDLGVVGRGEGDHPVVGERLAEGARVSAVPVLAATFLVGREDDLGRSRWSRPPASACVTAAAVRGLVAVSHGLGW